MRLQVRLFTDKHYLISKVVVKSGSIGHRPFQQKLFVSGVELHPHIREESREAQSPPPGLVYQVLALLPQVVEAVDPL